MYTPHSIPFYEWSACRRGRYLHNTQQTRQPRSQRDSNPQSQQSSGRRPMPTGIDTYTLKLVNLRIIYTPCFSSSNPAPGTVTASRCVQHNKRLRFMRSVTFTTYMEQRYKGNYFSRCFLISLFVQLLVFFHVSGPVWSLFLPSRFNCFSGISSFHLNSVYLSGLP